MHGSLALHRGTLFVGTEDKTAHVRVFDLDGRARHAGFSFRDARSGRSTASGLAVDEDRRIWVADAVASRVRRFSLFGREEGGLGQRPLEPLETAPWQDARGVVRSPLDVSVEGNAEEGRLAVCGAGHRRHAVQLFDAAGTYLASPRPGGDAEGRFRGVQGVSLHGRYLYVAETGAERVQVFRDGEFHFAFRVQTAGRARFEPVAVAALSDGRAVVACSGPASALLLVDGSGRLLRVLAQRGDEEGCVADPGDVVVDETASDRTSRVAVIDRDAERIQVFTLSGRCFGVFGERA